MKTKYLVIGLKDDTVLKDVYLSSEGLKTETEYLIIGKFMDVFDDYAKAIECVKEECSEYELGCKIETIFVKE